MQYPEALTPLLGSTEEEKRLAVVEIKRRTQTPPEVRSAADLTQCVPDGARLLDLLAANNARFTTGTCDAEGTVHRYNATTHTPSAE